jgi:ADP-heptose:LPS heptosyltransferase
VTAGPPALAIHPGALGDVLLAVPALRAWRSLRPGVPLALAAQPRIGALLQALGVVDAHHAFDDLRLDALFVDDPGSAPRLPAVAAVVSWFGAREPVYVRRLRARVPGAIVAPSVGPGLVWEHLLATVGSPPGDWRAAVQVGGALRAAGRAALGAAGWDGRRPLCVVHPGAGGAAKRWPAEAFAAALESAPAARAHQIVVHRGPADADAVAALLPRLGRPALVLDAPPLDTLAGALAEARLFVGNDSGVGHLAAAVGAPAALLCLAENLRWRAWAAGARHVQVRTDRADTAEVAAVVDAVSALVT